MSLRWIVAAITPAALLLGASSAQAGTGTGAGTAKIAQAITITQVDELNFGKFAPDGSGSNTLLDMLPNGSVVCSGASLCGGGTPSAGSFAVTGSPNQQVLISMPGNFFLTNGPHQVEIGNGVFYGTNVTQTSYFHSTGLFNSSGELLVKFRGALWMTAGTPVGDFSGSYTVTVNYQ